MAYRITYDTQPSQKQEKKMLWLQTLTAVFLLMFLLAAKFVWKDGIAVARDYLIPGDPSAALQSYEQLVCDLRDGQPVRESLVAFGKQLINAEAS